MIQLPRRWGVLMFFIISSFIGLNAQEKLDEIIINESFSNESISNILEKLASKYQFDVYKKEASVFDAKVSHTFENQSLGSAIDKILFGSSYDYVLYRDYAIMILPNRIANEVYSADYYQALEASLETDESSEKSKSLVVGDITKLNPSGAAVVKGIIVLAWWFGRTGPELVNLIRLNSKTSYTCY